MDNSFYYADNYKKEGLIGYVIGGSMVSPNERDHFGIIYHDRKVFPSTI